MNCIQHPEQPVAAYCQNCGKALCTACVRSVAGNVYCESCLAARLGLGGVGAPSAQGAAPEVGVGAEQGAGAGVNSGTVPGAMPPMPPPPIDGGPSPKLAAILGFCPGVGAMYNGQYVKAFVHVLIFCVLVGLTNTYDYFGMLIAAWVIYQVFDAYHTAEARRLGLPLPDPFGLNDLGGRLGIRSVAPPTPPPGASVPGAAYTAGPVSSGPEPAFGGYGAQPNAGPSTTGQQYAPGASAYAQGSAYAPGAESTPYANVGSYPPMGEPMMPPPARVRRPEPIGALILIGLGLLFLFNALGFFPAMWLGRGWPLLLIGLGVWLLVRRSWESNLLKGGGQ